MNRTESLSSSMLRQQLRGWMEECRQLTLALVADIDRETLCCHAHPDFSPVGWHLGHIAYTESLWLLEQFAKQPCPFPQYRRLFAADGVAKGDRVHLPSLKEIQDYLQTVREQVFGYLEIAPLDEQERIWRFLLQHESQHCETIAIVLELIKQRQGKGGTSSEHPSPNAVSPSRTASEMVHIPAGYFTCGDSSSHALDNEQPSHSVFLDDYWIDVYPVTVAQYKNFIAAGGYQEARWWSPQGWEWLQSSQVRLPLYWRERGDQDDHPVCGVSWYEADAYARFAGKRLPTELEWEKAARWNPITQQSQTFPWGEAEPQPHHCNHGNWVGGTTPVTTHPAGQSPSGCHDLLGNVWEWTASWFESYPGFTPFPYRGYSQAYFDGEHRILRGGSWATRKWAMRGSFRNWYHPHVREVFAGFRCAR